MRNPDKDPGTSDRPLEALARARHAEMQRAAERGERNVRHGASERERSLWELVVAWFIIVAFVVFVVWFVAFGYRTLTGDEDGQADTGASPDSALVEFNGQSE